MRRLGPSRANESVAGTDDAFRRDPRAPSENDQLGQAEHPVAAVLTNTFGRAVHLHPRAVIATGEAFGLPPARALGRLDVRVREWRTTDARER